MLMKEIIKQMTQTGGKMYHVLRQKEPMLSKYYPRKSTDSMQFQSNYQQHFKQNQNKLFFFNFVWGCKKPRIDKTILREKNKDGRTGCLTSDDITTLQLSKQYGNGTKREIQQNRLESPEINPCTYGQLI